MFNTLATAIAEKVKISDESEETIAGKRKNIRFWLLAAVPVILTAAGGSYFLIRRRRHR
jgi:hypothetical protein